MAEVANCLDPCENAAMFEIMVPYLFSRFDLMTSTSRPFVLFGALALGFCVCTLDAGAQEWTRFRGPNGTGVVEGVEFPTSWSDEDYAWQIDLPGQGHSSAVVYDGRAFLLSGDPKTAIRHVVAVDMKTGKTVWQRNYDSASHKLHSRNNFGSSTPAVDENAVYVAWSAPEETVIKALSHDGEELWSRNLGTWTSQHGFGTSPILADGKLILFNSQQKDQLPEGATVGESRMMAFDPSTGKTLWESPTNTTRVCYSVPCVRKNDAGNMELVCCNTGNGIFGMDIATGKISWELSVFDKRCVASPVMAGDVVLGSCGSGGGGNILVAVKAGENPQEVFRVRSNANYVPTPIVYGDHAYLFGDKGIVSCVDLKTGESVWRERLATGFSGSPICVSGKLYCMDEEGNMLVIAANPSFKELGKVELGETSRSTPAVADGMMLIRTDSRLRALPALKK